MSISAKYFITPCPASLPSEPAARLPSCNSIHSSCDPRNFLAMIEAGREFGLYS